ncbi:MAG: hypothetical protein A2Y71_00785 [Bacteroidetes bacterium RBG_13_42_15]|nr:MAG: hypothetical protein A2Y71_00785 [Bacteroidetes bacterium RBG_13_42_15]
MSSPGMLNPLGKIQKYLLTGLLIVLIICILAVVTPRIWSALNPEKPPVGYHFMAPAYAALWIGPACAEDIRNAVGWFLINGEKYGYDASRK